MRCSLSLCLLALTSWLTVSTGAVAQDKEFPIVPDVVYGHKDGLAMTFDVFTPKENANGAGVLFMVSGGWYSWYAAPETARPMFAPLVDAGFTVFAVRHGSSPRYGIPDAVSDVRLAVRFIRMNADKFKVDPDRLGVYGISAGGHLSLVLGTTSDAGNADDKDPVLRVSDRVQAVVAFVAPTDLTIMVKDAPDRLPAYDRFPALNLELPRAKELSPLFYVSSDDPPTLLLAGAKDDLVPIDHNRRIQKALEENHVENKLIEFENATHSFGPDDSRQATAAMIEWFSTHLAKK